MSELRGPGQPSSWLTRRLETSCILVPSLYIGDKYAALFHCPTMVQFFWQDDVIGVARLYPNL